MSLSRIQSLSFYSLMPMGWSVLETTDSAYFSVLSGILPSWLMPRISTPLLAHGDKHGSFSVACDAVDYNPTLGNLWGKKPRVGQEVTSAQVVTFRCLASSLRLPLFILPPAPLLALGVC